MDTYLSGEESIIKTRKPYTITKQRERWTEEEHNRFLEALKLHGRAWQRIEDHIGTKTAIQIRSHAQKFFSKLEKEALVKGIPVGQAIHIDIPPPRPKRRPNNPYPRKTCASVPVSQAGAKDGKYFSSESSSDCKQVNELGKEPLAKEIGGERKPVHQEDDCSEGLTQLQGAHPSQAYTNFRPKPAVGLGNVCSFREFVPSTKRANHGDASGSHVTTEINDCRNIRKNDTNEMDIEDTNPSQCQKFGDANASKDMHATQNFLGHVPVHIHCSNIPFQNPTIVHPNNLFPSSAASGTTTEHQTYASRSSAHQPFHPFNPPCVSEIRHSQVDYQSLLNMSSAFPSLLVSSLLQNPAAHAAASFAATFWPHSNNGKTSADSPALGNQANPAPPSMAAIADATVAAATAWWASHGLLPMCVPFPGPFSCSNPPSVGVSPPQETDQSPAGKTEEDKPLSPHLADQHSDSKASLSEREPSGGENPRTNLNATDDPDVKETPELHDPNKEKKRKQVDRSSCGSNTGSSSDIETDALEKKADGEEELKILDNNNDEENNPLSDSNICRCRSTSTSSDSWKEVSEEGRLAFQALFSRHVLPQSFSPPPDQNNVPNHTEERDGVTLLLDLNIRAWSQQEPEKVGALNNSSDEGLLTIGLGQGKLKARRTGFKPYKRCSVEAKESRLASPGSQLEEQGNKRLRLEGDIHLNI